MFRIAVYDRRQILYSLSDEAHKKISVEADQECVNYAAFINTYLFYRKVVDNADDSKRKITRKFFRILSELIRSNPKVRLNFEHYYKVVERLDHHFTILKKIESEPNSYLADELLEEFGETMSDIIEFSPCGSKEYIEYYKSVFCNLGKWMYIIDAIDDYWKDETDGRYNIITHLKLHDTSGVDDVVLLRFNKAKMINELLVKFMGETISKIDNGRFISIVGNIVTQGCVNIFYRVERNFLKHIRNS